MSRTMGAVIMLLGFASLVNPQWNILWQLLGSLGLAGVGGWIGAGAGIAIFGTAMSALIPFAILGGIVGLLGGTLIESMCFSHSKEQMMCSVFMIVVGFIMTEKRENKEKLPT